MAGSQAAHPIHLKKGDVTFFSCCITFCSAHLALAFPVGALTVLYFCIENASVLFLIVDHFSWRLIKFAVCGTFNLSKAS